MKRPHLSLTALATVAVGVVVAAGGVALACVPMPFMSVQPRASGPAGSEVTVTGASFPGPAEIRWNGPDGPLLARADGPDFSRAVKVPAAAEGLYVVFGVARDPGGGIAATASAAFQVTPLDGSSPAPARAPGVGADRASPSAPSSSGVGTGALVMGGVLLVALGALAGLLVARRRRRNRAVAAQPSAVSPHLS